MLQKYGGDQKLDEDQYQRPNLEIHLYDPPGKTWTRLISRHWGGEERDDGSLAEMLQSDGGHHNTNAKKQPIHQE